MCPGDDRYHGLPEPSPPGFSSHVLQFLWRLVKHSDLCCCVSKFFCSTSTDLEKCQQGCCGKCEEGKLSSLDSDTDSRTDADDTTEDEDEEDTDLDEESGEVFENEEKGEGDSATNDGDWWDDQ